MIVSQERAHIINEWFISFRGDHHGYAILVSENAYCLCEGGAMQICHSCGEKIEKDAKVCGKCGAPVRKKNLPVIIICSVLGAVSLGLGIFGIVTLIKKNNTPDTGIEFQDAESYYDENAVIRSVDPAKRDKDNMSEKEVLEELASRGFAGLPVTTDYSIDGSLIEEREISEDSSEKHPIYETNYIDSNDEVWNITLIGGSITASPVTYNYEHEGEVPLLVSETEEIVSYDSSENSFIRTLPKESALRVKTVKRIDAATLESIRPEA